MIRVDNSTGIVDVVPMYAGHAEIGESVARYLLSHYVTTCEGFSYATAERDYEECGAYHTARQISARSTATQRMMARSRRF